MHLVREETNIVLNPILTYLSFGVIDHDVVRLDVSVNDSGCMAEVESFEQLVHVEPNVVVRECGIENLPTK